MATKSSMTEMEAAFVAALEEATESPKPQTPTVQEPKLVGRSGEAKAFAEFVRDEMFKYAWTDFKVIAEEICRDNRATRAEQIRTCIELYRHFWATQKHVERLEAEGKIRTGKGDNAQNRKVV